MVSGWGFGCTVHTAGPLGGGENWPSHELCRTVCRGQAGAGQGLAGGAVIQRFPELRWCRQGEPGVPTSSRRERARTGYLTSTPAPHSLGVC